MQNPETNTMHSSNNYNPIEESSNLVKVIN